jgi:hypothetical protein
MHNTVHARTFLMNVSDYHTMYFYAYLDDPCLKHSDKRTFEYEILYNWYCTLLLFMFIVKVVSVYQIDKRPVVLF